MRMLIVSWLILAQFTKTFSYTVQDVLEGSECTPCNVGDKVPNPEDCLAHFYCDAFGKWGRQICPHNTFFDFSNPTVPVCKALSPGSTTCTAERANAYINIPLTSLSACVSVSVSTSTRTPATVAPNAGTTNDGNVNITLILGVLLGVTFAILIMVVLGIFLYRRRQNQRRPTYFYSRKLPQAGGLKGGASSMPPPSATNVAYSKRPLLRDDRDGVISGIYEEPNSDDGGYMEIPNKSSPGEGAAAYYSLPADNHRPPAPDPGQCEGGENEYTYASSGGDYMHPQPQTSSSTDNHMYSQTLATPPRPEIRIDTSAVTSQGQQDEPYEYCRPVSAHPTLSYRSNQPSPTSNAAPESPPIYVDPAPDNQSAGSRSESPPYYVDPIPQDYPSTERPSSHQYHLLEQVSKASDA